MLNMTDIEERREREERFNKMRDALIKKYAPTVRRLGWLIEAMQGVVEHHSRLDMENWTENSEVAIAKAFGLDPLNFNDEKDSRKVDTIELAHACNTSCCVAGWGGLHEELRKEGLVTDIELVKWGNSIAVEESLKIDGCNLGGYGGVGALGEFFGINNYEADICFGSQSESVEFIRRKQFPDMFYDDDKVTPERMIIMLTTIRDRYIVL